MLYLSYACIVELGCPPTKQLLSFVPSQLYRVWRCGGTISVCPWELGFWYGLANCRVFVCLIIDRISLAWQRNPRVTMCCWHQLAFARHGSDGVHYPVFISRNQAQRWIVWRNFIGVGLVLVECPMWVWRVWSTSWRSIGRGCRWVIHWVPHHTVKDTVIEISANQGRKVEGDIVQWLDDAVAAAVVDVDSCSCVLLCWICVIWSWFIVVSCLILR